MSGPQSWPQLFPSAAGVRQSPIDITPDITVYDPSLGNGRFKFDYDIHDCYELYNKGTTWAIKVKENCNSSKCFNLHWTDPKLCIFVCRYHCTYIQKFTYTILLLELTAIHLPGTYKLIDIHGHWGNDPNCGSEHLIAGVSYSAEVRTAFPL